MSADSSRYVCDIENTSEHFSSMEILPLLCLKCKQDFLHFKDQKKKKKIQRPDNNKNEYKYGLVKDHPIHRNRLRKMYKILPCLFFPGPPFCLVKSQKIILTYERNMIVQLCDIFQKKEKYHLILNSSATIFIMNVKSWCRFFFFNEVFPF